MGRIEEFFVQLENGNRVSREAWPPGKYVCLSGDGKMVLRKQDGTLVENWVAEGVDESALDWGLFRGAPTFAEPLPTDNAPVDPVPPSPREVHPDFAPEPEKRKKAVPTNVRRKK